MRIIVALDDNNGMLFNHRRQSQDRGMLLKMAEILGGQTLFISKFSEQLFNSTSINAVVMPNLLASAEKDDYCFVEDLKLSPIKESITGFIIFRWNRQYPSDFVLDVLPESIGMVQTFSEDFEGSSHNKITIERWCKRE